MLLRAFRALMPRDERFIQRFSEHARLIVPAAEAFRALMSGDGRAEQHAAEISRLEEAADQITRETVLAIHSTFITPFDRSQILDLTTALDDTIDLMKEAGRRIRLYRVSYTPQMMGMADCAVRATTALREVMPCLSSIAAHVDRFSVMQNTVRREESVADELFSDGLRELFGPDDPTGTATGRRLLAEKVYEQIESVVDRCEDVADVIEGIVVEQV